jgi:hypothetical protein
MKMATTILAIGLNSSLIDEFEVVAPNVLLTANCCSDAVEVLLQREVTTIVLDSRASNDVESDLNNLLSVTPVTTHIVLITPTTNVTDNQSFSDLGITTLTGPVSGADLQPYFI